MGQFDTNGNANDVIFYCSVNFICYLIIKHRISRHGPQPNVNRNKNAQHKMEMERA